MIIQGHFGERGRPRVVVRLQLPRFQNDAQVSFVVDTGADQSLLSEWDATNKLGIDYDRLNGYTSCEGVGGSLGVYPEDAMLIFEDRKGRRLAFNIEINVAERKSDARFQLPSLLGRDILDEFQLMIDRKRDILRLSIDSELSWP